LIVPAMVAVLLVTAAGSAGAYLVPAALQSMPSPTATPGFPLSGAGGSVPASAAGGLSPGPGGGLSNGTPGGASSGVPGGTTGQPTLPGPSSPGLLPTTTGAPAQPASNGVRPADALSGWAQQIGTRVGIPVVAVQAYGYAELVVGRTVPSCHLSWTTIAALAKVESAHGSANGAVLGADGVAQPTIYGLPLNGQGGRGLIRDTDRGVIDGDTTFDRAVGPLQFIPSTWQENKVDADNNGNADPNDIDDAALTAAVYLCKGGRDLSKADSWWDAVLSYNAVRPYAQKVFEAANDYGVRSRG
jgi:transglycosylase-like protein with SLT domain